MDTEVFPLGSSSVDAISHFVFQSLQKKCTSIPYIAHDSDCA